MAIDMDDLNREVMIDLKLGNDFRADVNQQKQIAHLPKHVRVLWNHVQRLEEALSIGKGELALKSRGASITLKSSGDIEIKGYKITMEGWGTVDIRGAKLNLNE